MGKTNRMAYHSKLAAALTLCILATAYRAALADSPTAYYWQNPQNGNFEDPAAWAMPDNSIPCFPNDVFFCTNSPTPYTVTFNQWNQIDSLTLINDHVTFNHADVGVDNTLYLDGTLNAPTGWIWANNLIVGLNTTGTLNLTNAATLISYTTIIGTNSGSAGTITIDGPASTWHNFGCLYIGQTSTGTLNVTNSSSVKSGYTYLGPAGSINFGPNGGTLTTDSLYASPAQLTGTGTINTFGLVSDTDLVFDSTHGLSQTVSWGNVTINLNQTAYSNFFTLGSPNPNNTFGLLGAGNITSGTLTIKDGLQVSSIDGCIAYFDYGCYSGAPILSPGPPFPVTTVLPTPIPTGTATVTGPGSVWAISDTLYVGTSGPGTLNITQGGTVNTSLILIGSNSAAPAIGTINIDGPGSSLTSTGITFLNSGSINITNSGTFTTPNVGASEPGPCTITVDGPGSTFNATNLCVGNNGASVAIQITHGGTMNAPTASIGNYGNGTVTIDGLGSAWNSSEIDAGRFSGTATINITHGGTINCATANIGSLGGNSILNIDGPGSSLNSGYTVLNAGSINITNGGTLITSNLSTGGAGPCNIAVDGPASTLNAPCIGLTSTTLNITNGGVVNSSSASMASVADATVSIDGPGSSWNSGMLTLQAQNNNATINISHGAMLTSSTTYIGSYYSSGGNGSINVDGVNSSWNGTSISIGYMYGTGILNVTRRGMVNCASASIGQEGGNGVVTVDGPGSILNVRARQRISATVFAA